MFIIKLKKLIKKKEIKKLILNKINTLFFLILNNKNKIIVVL